MRVGELTERCEFSHTVNGENRSKRQYIIDFKVNNPLAKASVIAEKAGTSVGYVYNVLSSRRKSVRNERWRCDRSNGLVSHGLSFYEDSVLPSWYESLEAPVVNARTGMKQVGFKAHGDLCTCQVHRNGRVVVFPYAVGWESWLIEALKKASWDGDRCELLVINLRFKTVAIEAGVKAPEGFLPKDLFLKTDWGVVVVKDDSPSKNTLELKLSVPDMKRYLGLPELSKQLQLLAQSGMTTNQLIRVVATAVIALTQKLASGEETR